MQTKLARDVAATVERLIVLDVNGVLLKTYPAAPDDFGGMREEHKPRIVQVKKRLFCAVRPDAEDFILTLQKKAKLMVWSCCRKEKLIGMLKACFPNIMRKEIFTGNAALSFLAV